MKKVGGQGVVISRCEHHLKLVLSSKGIGPSLQRHVCVFFLLMGKFVLWTSPVWTFAPIMHATDKLQVTPQYMRSEESLEAQRMWLPWRFESWQLFSQCMPTRICSTHKTGQITDAHWIYPAIKTCGNGWICRNIPQMSSNRMIKQDYRISIGTTSTYDVKLDAFLNQFF